MGLVALDKISDRQVKRQTELEYQVDKFALPERQPRNVRQRQRRNIRQTKKKRRTVTLIRPEMSFDVLLVVDDARAQRLFVGLSLEDFLFDGAGGQKAVDEARLLLAVSPHAGHRLENYQIQFSAF